MVLNMDRSSCCIIRGMRLNRSTESTERADKMDLWLMIKERYMLFSIFLIIIFISLFFLLATWKKHSDISKSLIVIITTICLVIILLSILALVFAASFGYNS